MDVSGRVAVVTGAAAGIGAAVAERLADAGVAGVVLADLDGAGAAAVAAAIDDRYPGRAVGVGCDVAEQAALAGLVERAESAYGPVDLFVANAGVAVGTDPATPDDVWDTAWDVNVMAHVRAARLLLPGWLERGEGYFVATASAAGLLTQIGSAPYAVTKHGAVAFAEWLSVTYGDRGVRVSCLCPMGVRTALLEAGAGGGGLEQAAHDAVVSAGPVLEPAEVADALLAAIATEQFLVLPHEQVLEFWRRKTGDYERWLAGMRRLQARLTG